MNKLKLLSVLIASCFASTAWSAAIESGTIKQSTSIADDITVTTSEGEDYAILAQEGTAIQLTGNSITVNSAEGGIRAEAESGSIVLGKEGSTVIVNSSGTNTAYAVWAKGASGKKGGRVEINGKSLIINSVSSTGQAWGLLAQNTTTGSTLDKATLIVNSENTVINTKAGEEGGGLGIVLMSEGVLEVNGNLEVNADYAIVARGGSVLKINESNTKTVKLNGSIDFNYDKPTSGTKIDSDVLINLTGPDSYWNGNAQYSYNGTPSEASKLNVSGLKLGISNGAVWSVSKTIDEIGEQSGSKTLPINDLTMNDGIITISDSTQTVNIENMTGTGGTINAQTVRNKDGSFSTAKLAVKSLNSEATMTEKYVGINSDEISAEDLDKLSAVATDSTTLTRRQVVEAGDINGEITREISADGTKGEVKEAVNLKQDAYQSLTAMNMLSWRHEMNDLTKRMGELRMSPQGIGSWARLYGSEQEYGDQNLKMKNTSIQVGADYSVGGGWTVGGAFTYTNGDAAYDLGDADSDSYSAAIYGTWLADNGFFLDLIGKYTWMESDFTLNGFDGSQKNNAVSASAEFGWHFKLNDLAFIEPQAELTYGRVFGDDFDGMANGALRISQDDFDSLIGRAGLRAGFYFPENRGTIYVRVSGAYDFMGDFEYTASNASTSRKFEDDLGGAWVEYAVGANFNLTESTYTYVDLERTSGGDVRENWRWNIGLRTVF